MNIIVTTIDYILNWSRANSLWPFTFATSCCGIELMQTTASNNDIARFGSEVFRNSPRQADLLICAGTINHKMAPVLLKLYQQMAEPKYVIAMGACACGGGMFCDNTYSVVNGIDKIIPVDIYLPMCPPRPEALLDAIRKLQKKIKTETITKRKEFVNSHKSNLTEKAEILVKAPDLKIVKTDNCYLDYAMEFECKDYSQTPSIEYIVDYESELLNNLANLKAAGFNILTSIIATDWKDCVELNYRLYSTFQSRFFDHKIYVKSETDSVTGIYPSAYFDECEIYDLFGITFKGNPNLKRLLNPKSWIGHPLKKDYVQSDERLVWNE